ncbi:MAG: competence/damage-inducible protein A [Candidatus Omnitrophica bacterium]|nr:competence/damage-inducible protein A [Candidatus Omnitrophota bacterium]
MAQKKKTAHITIITIGSEILSGKTLDTNSQFITQTLKRHGFAVSKIVKIKDGAEEIESALSNELRSANVVITTGGLGPTFDDMTTASIARYFGARLIFHQEAWKSIRDYFKHKRVVLTKARRAQAVLPEGCSIFKNIKGVAPGIAMHDQGKHVLAMPGVPYEMEAMCESGVVPYLKRYFRSMAIQEVSINTAGIAESSLERKIRWYVRDHSNSSVQYGIYPRCGDVQVKITVSGNNKRLVTATVERQRRAISRLIKQHIYGYDNDSLPEVVLNAFRQKSKTLGVAESCTGGLIAKTITDIAGASRVFKGGVVTYSNDSKSGILNIPEGAIKKYGAVSGYVARSLARGACRVFSADYGLGITGIAGPGGGTAKKPVGLVYIAIADKNETRVFKYVFPGARDLVRMKAMKHALFNILHLIQHTKD